MTQHKLYNHNFGNGFQTNNAILDVTPYDPEVLIVGTFNHGWSWNPSDFFYGRGMYMWTIMANFFQHNSNVLIAAREPSGANNNPTLTQIFDICKQGKLAFADVILGVKPGISAIEDNTRKEVIVNGTYHWNDYKDGHLNQMGKSGWLDDNVENIIDFVCRTKSIQHVYFTFNSLDWLLRKKRFISLGVRNCENVQTCCSIFTPTGMGFRQNLPAPFHERAWSIAHCWVWNGLPHAIPVNKANYCHLDHDWLSRNGVNVNNF